LEKDQSRAISASIGGDGESRRELVHLKKEIAMVRAQIEEIELSINKILDRPPSDRAERIALRQRQQEQIRERNGRD
jgi:uncharacterized glyoxalase superfamily metalloenzyme YdcJ